MIGLLGLIGVKSFEALKRKRLNRNEKSISKKNLSHHSQTGSELESHNAGMNFYVNDSIIIYFYFDFLIEIIRSKMIIILV